MLVLALLFLTLVGVVLPHGDSGEAFRENLRRNSTFDWILAATWGVIALESIAGLFLAVDSWTARIKRLLLILLIPPLRMTTATSTHSDWIWIPGIGWQHAGPTITERLEKRLLMPMVVLTLLVLPVLGAELVAGEALESQPHLALAVHLITCTIWIGFTAEFIWMLSATTQKLGYCLRNWINLLIIVLPLVAFLRVLNIFRFTRFLRAGKLLRAYRLRTLVTRLWQLALLFNLVERLQQLNPAAYCAGLEKKIAEQEATIAKLKAKLEAFRAKLALTAGTGQSGGDGALPR